jgi:hypothetical protein
MRKKWMIPGTLVVSLLLLAGIALAAPNAHSVDWWVIGGGCLYRWKRKLAEEGENAFSGHGRLAPEQERICQLERENEILRQERVAYFVSMVFPYRRAYKAHRDSPLLSAFSAVSTA